MSKRLLVLNSDGSTDGPVGVFSGGFPKTVILLSNGWEQQADGSYAQTITIPGVLDENRAIVDIDMSGATPSTYTTLSGAWGCIGRVYTVKNGITFVCYATAPGIDINVKVEVF